MLTAIVQAPLGTGIYAAIRQSVAGAGSVGVLQAALPRHRLTRSGHPHTRPGDEPGPHVIPVSSDP
ncbi:hypothetical protein [Dyella flava]|uniref:hypothetical protein n=1 Tax=Dyella flava TaxID=1920170 RepID=UPI0024E0F477|nr:hypothetical protein [Dyella flava]